MAASSHSCPPPSGGGHYADGSVHHSYDPAPPSPLHLAPSFLMHTCRSMDGNGYASLALAKWSANQTAKLWDVKTGVEPFTFRFHAHLAPSTSPLPPCGHHHRGCRLKGNMSSFGGDSRTVLDRSICASSHY